MLTHVRKAAARRGLTNIETFECAAEDLPQTLAAFDAAISRLGLMLFPAPAGVDGSSACPEAEGAHRRAGLHDAFGEPLHVSAHANPASPCREGTARSRKAGIFVLGGPAVFLKACSPTAGWKDVQASVMRAPLRLSSAAEALEMMQQAFGAYRAVVADLDPKLRGGVIRSRQMLEAVRGP